MNTLKFALFLLVVFIICNGQSCIKSDKCDDYKVELFYDNVEQMSVQITHGEAPYTYKWSNGLGNGPIALAPGPGTYSVTVTDHKGCTKSASVVVK